MDQGTIQIEDATDWITEIRSTMSAWAKTRSKHGAVMVERLLKRIVDEQKCQDFEIQRSKGVENKCIIKADTKIYNILIDAWAKSGEPGAAKRAEEILIQMDRSGDPDMAPDVKSFSSVINAWALTSASRLGQYYILNDGYVNGTVYGAAAVRAERILNAMEEMSQSGTNPRIKPNTISYNTVISAWARSGSQIAYSRAERVLHRMHELQNKGDSLVAPDARSYTALMKAVARSSKDPAQAARKAEEILRRMRELSEVAPNDKSIRDYSQVKPTLYTYTTAIQIVSRSPEKDAPQRALSLLQDMIHRYEHGDEDLKPNVLVFNAVISAFSRSRERGSAQSAEKILKQMERMAASADQEVLVNDHFVVRPNLQSYILVIEAYSRSIDEDGAEHAADVHQRMINLYKQARERMAEISKLDYKNHKATAFLASLAKPSVDSFNEVIKAWAYRGNPQKAQATFNMMQEMYAAGSTSVNMHTENTMSDADCKPNTDSYAALIEAWGANSQEESGAQRAECLLRRIEQEYHDGNHDVRPDLRCYTSVIEAYARSHEESSAHRAEGVLRRMIHRHKQTSGLSDVTQAVKPDARCFSAVIDAYTRGGERTGYFKKVESLLREMTKLDVRMEVFSYTSFINALAQSGDMDSAQKAQDILDWMERSSRSGENLELTPNTITYSAVINAWSKSGDSAAAEKAEAILDRLIALYDTGNKNIKLDTISFTSVMNAWSRSGREDAPQKAERLLRIMEERYDNGNGIYDLKPDAYVYNTLISAWSWSTNPEGSSKALEYLKKMEQLYHNVTNGRADESVRPTTFSYNQVIHAFCKHGKVKEARKLFEEMERLVTTEGRDELAPNSHTFFALIKAYSQGKTRKDAEAADILLNKMLRKYFECGTVDIKPSPAMFNLVINAWGKCVSLPKFGTIDNSYHAATKAEALLRVMLDLNKSDINASERSRINKATKEPSNDEVKTLLYCFASVINSYSKSGAPGSAKKAYNLLQEMKKKHEVKAAMTESVPFSISYSSVINALSRDSSTDSAILAEQVLMELEEIEESGNAALGPNAVNYNYVINGYAKSELHSGVLRAESVLERMESRFKAGYLNAIPNTISYNIVLNALCKHEARDAGRKSLNLLARMERLHSQGHSGAKPDLRSYTACIKCLSRSKDRGSPQVAEGLLERLENLCRNGDLSFRPDKKLYTAVINCWTHSMEKDKAVHAQNVLRRMEEAYRAGNYQSKPDLFTYNTVMLACAFTEVRCEEERRRALKVAFQIYRQVKTLDYAKPDDAFYSSFLKACNNLMPLDESRGNIVEAVFKRCCLDGVVSTMVLSELKRTPIKLLQVDEVVSNYVDVSDLKNHPQAWTRNISKTKSRRGRDRHIM